MLTPPIEQLFVVYFKPVKHDLYSFLVANYLRLIGEYEEDTHVGLLIFYADGTSALIQSDSNGVYKLEAVDGLLPYRTWYQEVPYYSSEWIHNALVHFSLLRGSFPLLNYIIYPFAKTKPLVCTGFIEHLLMLTVTNCTPKKLRKRVKGMYDHIESTVS